MLKARHHGAFCPCNRHQFIPWKDMEESLQQELPLLPLHRQSPLTTTTTTIMEKLLCAVFVSSFLLATLADGASSSLYSSLSRQQAQVLGRKGRELDLLRCHYRHEGKHKEQPEEVVAMEVKKTAETKAAWTDQDKDAKQGLIYNEDYSGVAMHSRSPPTHKHPKP